MRLQKRPLSSALAAAVSLGMLAGCSGAVGNESNASAGEGFAFGSSQAQVEDAIAELDPVTLVYQAAAPSQDAAAAVTAVAFKHAVEERSSGQITLDVVWGQAIAGYPELDDALADGRVDIAYHLPIYDPTAYPGVDTYNKLTQYSSPSPLVGEAVSQAMMSEAAWNSEQVLDDYRDKGLTALSPLLSSGDYWIACNEPGSTMEDWDGRQIRVAATAQSDIAASIGASPVSMEYGETFEALQRGTIDCTFLQAQVAASTGLLEVAPHISVLSEGRMTGGANAAHVAGSGFTGLPLAYQQIVFDAEVDQFHGQMATTMDSALQAVGDAQAAGGTFTPLAPDVEKTIADTQERLVDELIAQGRIEEDIRSQMDESAEKWTQIVDELGYSDGGDLTDLTDWYSVDSVDFRPLAQRVFEAAALPHRPH